MTSDILKLSWIEALPEKVKPYAYIARLDRPIGWWLLLLPGWASIMLAAGGVNKLNMSDIGLIVLFLCGAIVMRSAGCVINDLWDRKLDQKVQRTKTRPLASGALNIKEASLFLCALLLLGLCILMQLNIVTVLLGFLSLPLIVVYPLMKRWTWWPQVFLGLVFNFSALMGWSAVSGVVDPSALLIYAACVFWTIGYDTIYAHQDKEDDILAGIKSSALKLGKKSKSWVSKFYLLSLVCLALSGVLAGAGFAFYFGMALASVHMRWQIKEWDMDDQASSLRIFKSNRDFGFLIVLACALSGL